MYYDKSIVSLFSFAMFINISLSLEMLTFPQKITCEKYYTLSLYMLKGSSLHNLTHRLWAIDIWEPDVRHKSWVSLRYRLQKIIKLDLIEYLTRFSISLLSLAKIFWRSKQSIVICLLAVWFGTFLANHWLIENWLSASKWL